MMRIATIPLVLLLLTAVCMYATQRGAETTADFTFIPDGSITTLDPHEMSWAQDICLAQSLWEGLYATDPQTRLPVPAAASSVDISPDSLTYTFHLRPEARWSNGDPLRATDFIFAWRRMLEEPAEYSSLFYCIAGAEAYQSAYEAGDKPDWSRVGIASPDDHTLVVTLRMPTPFFLGLQSMPAFFPLHEESMRPFAHDNPKTGGKTYDERFTQPPNLITNGPYKMMRWAFRRRIRLEKSPYYWNADNVALNVIDQVDVEDPLATFQAYHTGSADFVMTVSPELRIPLRDAHREDLRIFKGFGTYFYTINCNPKLNDGTPNPLADVRVRQALAMAMDRQAVVDTIARSGEEAAERYIPPGIFPGYPSPDGLSRDPDKARALLAEAGYPQGKNFPRLTLMFNTGANHEDIAQVVRRQWQQELGITIDLDGLETSTFRTKLRSKNYMIARASWLGDYNDPTTFTDKYLSQSDGNDAAWKNADYDRLLHEAQAERDPSARMQLLSQAEGILNQEAPIIPVYYYVHAYLIRPWVKGIPTDPQRMIPLQHMRVERQ